MPSCAVLRVERELAAVAVEAPSVTQKLNRKPETLHPEPTNTRNRIKLKDHRFCTILLKGEFRTTMLCGLLISVWAGSL